LGREAGPVAREGVAAWERAAVEVGGGEVDFGGGGEGCAVAGVVGFSFFFVAY
jgi:hypothetical protein